MSNFDPQSFLDSSITESLDTKIVPCPVGEYQGIIEKVFPRQWAKGEKAGIAIDIFWMVEDQGVKEALGRETVIVKQGIMLDTTPDGRLDTSKGMNVGLGRLREATGHNVAGQPFSFAMLPGCGGKITVTHRLVGEDTFAEVKTVGKL